MCAVLVLFTRPIKGGGGGGQASAETLAKKATARLMQGMKASSEGRSREAAAAAASAERADPVSASTCGDSATALGEGSNV